MWPTVEKPEGMSSKSGGRVAVRISSERSGQVGKWTVTCCPEIVV